MLFAVDHPSSWGRSLCFRAGWVCLAALLVLFLSTPAWGGVPPKVYGVSQSQTVTGPVVIWAEAQRVSHWMSIRLTGPGTSLESKTAGNRVHLSENGSTGAPVSWDASKAIPGVYTLRVVSYVRNRALDRETVTFRVARPVVPTTAEVLADPPPVLPQSLVEQGGEEPSREVVDRRGDALPLPTAKFVKSVPETLIENVRVDLPIALSGEMPAGGDVLVLCWDKGRQQMVDGFGHVVKQVPWVVDAEHVAELPKGEMELQLHVRQGSRFVQTDKRAVTVKAAVGTGSGRLPRVNFASGSPRRYERGSTSSLLLDVEGPLPAGADLLAIGWSLGQGRLVESFSVPLTQGPWAIPASQLNKLPEGVVEVQVLTRHNGKVKRKTTHTMQIVEPATPTSAPGTPAPGTPGTPGSNPGNNPDVTPDGTPRSPRTPVGPQPKTDAPSAPNTPDTPTTPAGLPGGAPGAKALPTTVGFTANAPDDYTRGSKGVINVKIDGSLPANGDLLMLAWHKDERRLIESFAHTLTGGDRRVHNGLLDKLPSGKIELQAHLRLGDTTIKIAKQNLRITVPGEPAADPPVVSEPVAPGSGFTAYPVAKGARVIYVSASGSDANAGTSSNAPIKSPHLGVEKLRDGYPDQLLFKAGDTFSNGIGSFTKSGRSANEKMVVGVYGDGARPLFRTQGKNLVSIFGSVSNVAFVGLHGYANRRDPSSPDFRSNDIPYSEAGFAWYAKGQNLVVEDCHLEWYKDNFIIQAPKAGDIRNVLLYRVISNNAWCDHKKGHAQGLYVQGVHGMEVVESTFDHNGWRPGKISDRTKFNHNMYIQKDCQRINVRRNILTRGSHHGVQLRSGGEVEDNLIAYNGFGVLVAQGASTMRRNVVLNGQDISSKHPLGYGLQTLPCVEVKIEDNLIAHKDATASWTPGIELAYRDDIIDPPGSYNVDIRRNIIATWPVQHNKRSIIQTTGSVNIRVDSGNVLDRESGGEGDPPFVDATRDLDRYGNTLGKGNYQGFLRTATQRGRGAWEDRYAAAGANRWIRAGFDFLPYD